MDDLRKAATSPADQFARAVGERLWAKIAAIVGEFPAVREADAKPSPENQRRLRRNPTNEKPDPHKDMVISSLFSKAAEKAAKPEFAPGIPADRAVRPIGATRDAEWTYTRQTHHAERAGTHFDLRLSDGVHAHSWATKKELPEPGGDAREVFQQPTHTHDYMKFSGRIPAGYGAGRVELTNHGPVDVHKASDDQVHFTLTHTKNPQSYLLLRGKKPEQVKKRAWWLINVTPTEASRDVIPAHKPSFKQDTPANADKYMTDDWVARAKIDGAHNLLHFKDDKLELFSYRRPTKGNELINHSHIQPLGPGSKDLNGTVVRVETFLVDRAGNMLPNRTLAGVLNSSPAKARKTLSQNGWRLKSALLSPYRFQEKRGARWQTEDTLPYDVKREILHHIHARLDPDVFILPHEETTADGKRRMLDAIKTGVHPETDEGVVFFHRTEPRKPVKMKFRETHDVYVREIVEGAGSHRGMAGAYHYSLTPTGPVVGKVGTGALSHDDRHDLWKNRADYVGRKAVVTSEEQHPSGALRSPVHSHWHV